MQSESELVKRAQSGDRQSFCQLVESIEPLVRRRTRHLISERYRALIDEEDVMQVTFCEALASLSRFTYRRPGSFGRWFQWIAVNNVRDAVKALRRRKREPIGGFADVPVECSATTLSTPSRHVARYESSALVSQALRRLPQDYQTVLRLHVLDANDIRDVALVMGRSVGAVYMLRARAIEHLARLIPSEGH